MLKTKSKPHTRPIKKTAKAKPGLTIVKRYDVAADGKKRISLRGAAPSSFFHVKMFSNGAYLLEPRVLVAPEAVSPRTLKRIQNSVANLKAGKVSAPIDLSLFTEN